MKPEQLQKRKARLRTTGEAIWTPERLKEEMKKLLENKMMVVVSRSRAVT
jgi:hypothetical protein